MRKASLLLCVISLAFAGLLFGQSKEVDSEPFRIDLTPLGDTAEGVVVKIVFHYAVTAREARESVPMVQGSISSGDALIGRFRRPLRPDEGTSMTLIRTVPQGSVVVTARLMLDVPDDLPRLLARAESRFDVESTGTPYAAAEEDGAEAFLAEGAIPETSGAVTILPPRRDLAPNLFIVEVAVKKPAERIEFWVEGRKIITKNAPPYRAELDLGAIPRRVEVRAVGYDRRGRYVDADAWIVNERDNQLEVKLTRTVTPDQINHFKISIQNPNGAAIGKVTLFAEDRVLAEWNRPPYALDLPGDRLSGAEFVTATAVADNGYEASDLLYLDGNRYTEQIDVNLVELPVSVTDEKGVPILDLEQSEFTVFEDGELQKVSGFAFSDNLPLSLGVMVDHSGSMLPRIEDARAAAVKFFEQILGERDRAFFGGFSWETTSVSPLVSEVGVLRKQIDEMPPAIGGTALHDAIVSGLYRFRGVDGRKALVIVTDGEDTASRISYDEMLNYVRVSRVPLYFIGIGISRLDFSASSKLRSLAAETGGVAYFVKSAEDLDGTYEEIERELRSQYLISYYAESTKDDSAYRLVEVRVSRPAAKVRTIRGFIP